MDKGVAEDDKRRGVGKVCLVGEDKDGGGYGGGVEEGEEEE